MSPLGFVRDAGEIVLRPFVSSRTLDNLIQVRHAVMNLVDDVSIIAGCLTGRRDWPVLRVKGPYGWRLRYCLTHLEMKVTEYRDDPERPSFRCAIVREESHGTFSGFNRAQAAVLEGSILVSRLDWLAPEKVAAEMAYLQIAIRKTAGNRELMAWQWLVEAIQKHPRHTLNLGDVE